MPAPKVHRRNIPRRAGARRTARLDAVTALPPPRHAPEPIVSLWRLQLAADAGSTTLRGGPVALRLALGHELESSRRGDALAVISAVVEALSDAGIIDGPEAVASVTAAWDATVTLGTMGLTAFRAREPSPTRSANRARTARAQSARAASHTQEERTRHA